MSWGKRMPKGFAGGVRMPRNHGFVAWIYLSLYLSTASPPAPVIRGVAKVRKLMRVRPWHAGGPIWNRTVASELINTRGTPCHPEVSKTRAITSALLSRITNRPSSGAAPMVGCCFRVLY